jgi:hypothetical protein
MSGGAMLRALGVVVVTLTMSTGVPGRQPASAERQSSSQGIFRFPGEKPVNEWLHFQLGVHVPTLAVQDDVISAAAFPGRWVLVMNLDGGKRYGVVVRSTAGRVESIFDPPGDSFTACVPYLLATETRAAIECQARRNLLYLLGANDRSLVAVHLSGPDDLWNTLGSTRGNVQYVIRFGWIGRRYVIIDEVVRGSRVVRTTSRVVRLGTKLPTGGAVDEVAFDNPVTVAPFGSSYVVSWIDFRPNTTCLELSVLRGSAPTIQSACLPPGNPVSLAFVTASQPWNGGRVFVASGYADHLIADLSASGVLRWTRVIPDATPSDEAFPDVVAVVDEGQEILVAGEGNGSLFGGWVKGNENPRPGMFLDVLNQSGRQLGMDLARENLSIDGMKNVTVLPEGLTASGTDLQELVVVLGVRGDNPLPAFIVGRGRPTR